MMGSSVRARPAPRPGKNCLRDPHRSRRGNNSTWRLSYIQTRRPPATPDGRIQHSVYGAAAFIRSSPMLRQKFRSMPHDGHGQQNDAVACRCAEPPSPSRAVPRRATARRKPGSPTVIIGTTTEAAPVRISSFTQVAEKVRRSRPHGRRHEAGRRTRRRNACRQVHRRRLQAPGVVHQPDDRVCCLDGRDDFRIPVSAAAVHDQDLVGAPIGPAAPCARSDARQARRNVAVQHRDHERQHYFGHVPYPRGSASSTLPRRSHAASSSRYPATGARRIWWCSG